MAKRKSKPTAKKTKPKSSKSSGNKNRLIMADLVAQSWKDGKFRAKLLKDPKTIMEKAGITGIGDANIRLLDNTTTTKHVVLPSNLSPENIHTIIDDYFRKILPLPEGQEVVFVQNTADLKNIVLPSSPATDANSLDGSHANVLAAAGFETVTATAAVNANMNAVVLVNAVVTGPSPNVVAVVGTNITDPVVVAVVAASTFVV